jgi:hypothetical protein
MTNQFVSHCFLFGTLFDVIFANSLKWEVVQKKIDNN